MTRWDIDYPSAMGVVQRAAAEAESYESDFTKVESAATECVGALPHSQLVAPVLAEFVGEVLGPALGTVAGHTGSAVTGTATACNAYVAGDTEMAATAQENAALARYPEQMPGAGASGGMSGGAR